MDLEECVEQEHESSNIKESLNKLGYELFFQPIVDPFDGSKISRAEGLMRKFSFEENRYLSPYEFFPSNKSMTRNIDIFAFESALQLLEELDIFGHSKIPINVNLSNETFKDSSLVDVLRDIHLKYPIVDPSLIQLEITEDVLNYECSTLEDNLKRLYKYGYKIAVDDVGKGNSSIFRVVNYPVNCLKFDKSFVECLEKEDNDSLTYAFMKKMMEIQYITSRDLEFVVEGVETREQAKRFYDNFPPHKHQGYYYSKPIKKDEFLDKLYRE